MAALAKKQVEEFAIIPGENHLRRPIFSVLVKRTYDIQAGKLIRAEKSLPLCKTDIYYDQGDPEYNSVKYETDLIPYKIATDVIVIGKAHAPGGQPVTQLDIQVEIAASRKKMRVTGDRKCIYQAGLPPAFTDPVVFTEMEIRYEKAYGGTDEKSIPDLPFSYPRNTVGTGMAIRNLREVVDGLPLPNIEDPDDLLVPQRVILGELENWKRQPLPQGMGWFQRIWYPRCSFIGVVPGFVTAEDVLWEEELGFVPKGQIALARQFKLPSFDIHFNNGASLGLAVPYLQGGEPVIVTNMTAEGECRFHLPTDKPRVMLDISLGENELETQLHTVCIRLEDKQVDLVWRGAHEYPGIDWLPEMKRMTAQVE